MWSKFAIFISRYVQIIYQILVVPIIMIPNCYCLCHAGEWCKLLLKILICFILDYSTDLETFIYILHQFFLFFYINMLKLFFYNLWLFHVGILFNTHFLQIYLPKKKFHKVSPFLGLLWRIWLANQLHSATVLHHSLSRSTYKRLPLLSIERIKFWKKHLHRFKL